MLLPDDYKAWLCCKPTDMRKAINGLSQMVVDNMNLLVASFRQRSSALGLSLYFSVPNFFMQIAYHADNNHSFCNLR